MSTTKIALEVKKGGVLTDVTEVRLEDPTATYGVQRLDTLASVVAAGTVLTRVSLGTYEYTFTDPASDLKYSYYLRVNDGGIVSYIERETSNPVSAASMNIGRYATSACLEERWGEDNINKWATLGNTDSISDRNSRISTAIADAEHWVDDMLRGGPYVVPFDTPVPNTIKRLACVLAGVFLYEGRGTQDVDEEGKPINKLSGQMNRVEKALALIKAGRMRLVDASTSHPKVKELANASDSFVAPTAY